MSLLGEGARRETGKNQRLHFDPCGVVYSEVSVGCSCFITYGSSYDAYCLILCMACLIIGTDCSTLGMDYSMPIMHCSVSGVDS